MAQEQHSSNSTPMAVIDGKTKKSEIMKRLTIILTLICASLTVSAQNIDLTKLPKAERDSMAIQIAIAAMKKYAPSHYNASIVPTVSDVTYDTSDKHQYPPSLEVEFFFDLKKAIEEDREGEPVYGGTVYIRAETGEPIWMLPTGWERFISVKNVTTRGGGQQEIAPPMTVPRNPWKGVFDKRP